MPEGRSRFAVGCAVAGTGLTAHVGWPDPVLEESVPPCSGTTGPAGQLRPWPLEEADGSNESSPSSSGGGASSLRAGALGPCPGPACRAARLESEGYPRQLAVSCIQSNKQALKLNCTHSQFYHNEITS